VLALLPLPLASVFTVSVMNFDYCISEILRLASYQVNNKVNESNIVECGFLRV